MGERPVKIGKQFNSVSGISTANADMIVIRGFDLCSDLIGSVSLPEHFWLLTTGQRPTKPQTQMLDACLVAISEHGLVPSVAAARMTYAAGPEAMQGAVAAGILGCGSVILGSAENAGKFLHKVVERAAGGDLTAAARAVAEEYRANKIAFPGYGHPLHRGGDPRVTRLLEVAKSLRTAGRYVAAAREVEK